MRSRVTAIVLTGMLILGAAGCGKEEPESLAEISGEELLAEEAGEPSQDSSKGASQELSKEEKSSKEERASEGEKASEEKKGFLYVDVCGRVKTPGVYELPEGSRVFQALEMAGGAAEDAALACLNQAEKLSDGQKIYVPSKEEAEGLSLQEASALTGTGGGDAAPGEEDGGRVNINTAGIEELTTLNGIGASRAEAILQYREEEGGFQAPEDIMKVPGIKEGIYEKIRDQIEI